MPDPLGHLPAAIRRVAESEQRISEAETSLTAMFNRGQDISVALRALSTMYAALDIMRDHQRYLESE